MNRCTLSGCIKISSKLFLNSALKEIACGCQQRVKLAYKMLFSLGAKW